MGIVKNFRKSPRRMNYIWEYFVLKNCPYYSIEERELEVESLSEIDVIRCKVTFTEIQRTNFVTFKKVTN